MCGIVGLAGSFASSDKALLRKSVHGAAARLAHRGPDGQGEWISGDAPVGLGHRRLAVIDLTDAARQPMISPNGRHAVTFNGEIYNYRDLRRRLEQLGHLFATDSDTEVLLVGCQQWGAAGMASRAVGMFAFAYVTLDDRMVWLVRDRFGEKPLYWYCVRGTLAFASELKALATLPDFPGTLNQLGVADVLTRGYVAQDRTIYEEVRRVSPGTAIGFPLTEYMVEEEAKLAMYWDADAEARQSMAAPFTGSLDDAVEAVGGELERSVKACMVSDVPIGAFLSGGIDSSLVTALMQRQADSPVQSFTIGFQNAHLNEAEHAARVAEALGTNHTSLTLSTADVLAVVPTLAEMYDEPFGDSSQVATHLVAHLARQKVTVALSGDGGDELFGGYNRHTLAPRLSH